MEEKRTESVFLLDHKFLYGIGMSDEVAEDSSESEKEVSIPKVPVPSTAKFEGEPLASEIKILKDGFLKGLTG